MIDGDSMWFRLGLQTFVSCATNKKPGNRKSTSPMASTAQAKVVMPLNGALSTCVLARKMQDVFPFFPLQE